VSLNKDYSLKNPASASCVQPGCDRIDEGKKALHEELDKHLHVMFIKFEKSYIKTLLLCCAFICVVLHHCFHLKSPRVHQILSLCYLRNALQMKKWHIII